MKKSETYIWISLFLAAAFFFITWLLLQWNFAVSALLSAGIYVAMTMLIKPVRKIGNVNLEIMPEGEALGRKLEEARMQMLKDIEKGKYDAILAWHPDRLSRNSLEAGMVVDIVMLTIVQKQFLQIPVSIIQSLRS